MQVFAARTRAWLPIVVWTGFVWLSRIRNVWLDDDLSTAGQVLRTGYSVVFLGFAAASTIVLRRARHRALATRESRLLGLFLVWTVGFWLIRGIGIIVDDHDLGFTMIHTVLMVISLGLAGRAFSALRAEPVRPSISASVVG